MDRYLMDGDRVGYAKRVAGFVRAISEPIIAASLLPVDESRYAESAMVEAFYDEIEARAAESPGEFVPRNVHLLLVARRI